MLSAELELTDLDARHWKNWWQLLVPPRVRARPPWALAVLDRTPSPSPSPSSSSSSSGAASDAAGVEAEKPAPRVVKLIVTGRGSIDPASVPLLGLDGRSLAAWASALDVAAVVAVERELVGKLSAEIEAALRLEQDLVAQALIALRALRRYAGSGVWTEPPLLELLPAPAFEPVQRTFDLLVPDRSALVAYVIEDDRSRVHASLIAVKDGGDIVRAATHRAIADLVPEAALARAWDEGAGATGAAAGKDRDRPRGYRRVLAAVEERFARPSSALFLERATLSRVMTGPSDQLARELNAKRVVIDPAPAWLLGLLGGAAVAAMAGRAASALAQMLPQGARDRASQLASMARGAMKESGAHPFALLGFDPLELWARLRHFYRE
ncbi:MAG TPA: hypothetical protein VNO30_19380 [Kofleriaceae bacterium]|nr:hypothetical protein [Kofleriaceae bacterium]